MLPSLPSLRPRTVTIVGRLPRSRPNFSSIAQRSAGPVNASTRREKTGPHARLSTGKSPLPGSGGKCGGEGAGLPAGHKILDNDKVERVAAQRRLPQAINIQQRQRRAPVIVAIVLKYSHSPSLWPNRLS